MMEVTSGQSGLTIGPYITGIARIILYEMKKNSD